MPITFGALSDRITRLVDDVVDDELLVEAISASFDAILPWMPKLASVALATDGKLTVFSLPDDFYDIEALLDESTGSPLPRASLASGGYFGTSVNDNNWLLYPSGSISLSKAATTKLTLYYLAHYAKPDDTTTDDSALEIPDKAEMGVALYASAYLMLPDIVSIAEISQFKTKVDSGNPEHSPRMRAAEYMLKLFRDEMNRHPSYQRVIS